MKILSFPEDRYRKLSLIHISTEKVRNYKKVVVDSSVQGGEIVLNQLRVKNLEVAADADCTVTANDTVFDQIGKSAAGAGRAAGNFTLNLGAGSSVAKLVAGSNMTVNGALKIAEVEVAEVVQGFTAVSYTHLDVYKRQS